MYTKGECEADQRGAFYETLEATASLGYILFMETKFYPGSRDGKTDSAMLMGIGKILKSLWGQKWCCGYFWK